MGYVFLLAIALVIVLRSTTAAERRQSFVKALKSVDRMLFRIQIWWREIEPFRETLCTRTRIAPVTPMIAAVNLAVVIGMFFYPQLLNDPNPLISWGANFGPRTANGEWWRLITTLFVHAGVLDLVVCLLAFVPLGLMLERIVGPIAFAAVYLTAGLFSSLFMLSAFPVSVSAGAAGAVAGVYAFMGAVLLWGVSQKPRLVLPLITIKLLAVCGGLFVAYSWVTGAAAVVFVGFVSGLIAGLTVSRGVNTSPTPAIRIAATVATMLCVAVVTAVPLRGITDARRTIETIVETETRTAQAFKVALQDFTDGRMNDKALAVVIDRVIVPELDYVSGRLAELDRNMVPKDQLPMVAAAEEYLKLRTESWTLRANALRGGKMSILWIADKKEALSLEALRRLKSGTSSAGNP